MLILVIVGAESGQADLLKFIHQNFIADERGVIVNLLKFICVNADRITCVFLTSTHQHRTLLYSSHFSCERKDYIGNISWFLSKIIVGYYFIKQFFPTCC